MKLSPITKPQLPPEFSVCDIESMNWTDFICIGQTDTGELNNYYEFRSLEKYLEFLETHPGPDTIVAHFGGKFDFLFLLEEILKHPKYKIGVIVPRGSSILYFSAVIGTRDYTFRDSSALLPFSLKSISENFGVENKKGDWDHTKTKGWSPELSEYLKFDCMSLHQSLQKLFSWPLIQKSGPSWTMAGQAMRVFRTYLKKDLYGLGKFESDFCRAGYLGGRTEIFRPYCEKGPLYEYDVNSLYPYIMRDNFFPHGDAYFTFDFVRNKLGLYYAEVYCPPEIDIPVLGIVREGKYIFPQGFFTGCWTTTELLYAESLGYILFPKQGLVFKKKEKHFTDFINDLYNIRLTSPKNSVSDIMAKLLMNSSYGRYGMNTEKENIGFELKEGVEEYEIIEVGNKKVQLYKEPVSLNTFTHVALAAHVTSYARIHMHKLFSPLGHHLYYTDTDSIFTTQELPTGKGLGEIKLECIYDSAIFLLPKTYFASGKAKNKIAMKGFDKRKIKDFDISDFKNALEGDLRKFKIENEPKFATLKTALMQKKLVTMTKKSEKQLRQMYDKRIIFRRDNELFTKPIVLNEKEI